MRLAIIHHMDCRMVRDDMAIVVVDENGQISSTTIVV